MGNSCSTFTLCRVFYFFFTFKRFFFTLAPSMRKFMRETKLILLWHPSSFLYFCFKEFPKTRRTLCILCNLSIYDQMCLAAYERRQKIMAGLISVPIPCFLCAGSGTEWGKCKKKKGLIVGSSAWALHWQYSVEASGMSWPVIGSCMWNSEGGKCVTIH